MQEVYYENIKNTSHPVIYHRSTQEIINLDWDEESSCHDRIKDNWQTCMKGDLSQSSKILMIGDSHAGQLNEFMDYMGGKKRGGELM